MNFTINVVRIKAGYVGQIGTQIYQDSLQRNPETTKVFWESVPFETADEAVEAARAVSLAATERIFDGL